MNPCGKVIGGEVRSLTPGSGGSSANTEYTGVSNAALVVAQGVCPPMAETLQPTGSAGGSTESKFSVKIVTGAPSVNGTDTIPRSVEPSCNWNVAITNPPHEPVAVNVKACVVASPPASNAPYDCALDGATIPFVSMSVTSTLVVSRAPVFRKAKFTVTVSPGSIASFGGKTASATMTLESKTTPGPGKST